MKKNTRKQNTKLIAKRLKRQNKKKSNAKAKANVINPVDRTLGELYADALANHSKNVVSIENTFDELAIYKDRIKTSTWKQFVELKDEILSFDKTCDKTLDLDAIINDEVEPELHLTVNDIIEDASDTVFKIAQHTLDRTNIVRDMIIQITNDGFEENAGDVVEHHTDVQEVKDMDGE